MFSLCSGAIVKRYKKLEKERKQREFQKRSNDIDYEDFEDDFVDTFSGGKDKVSGIFTPSGLVLVGVAAFLFYNLILKSKKREEDFKDD